MFVCADCPACDGTGYGPSGKNRHGVVHMWDGGYESIQSYAEEVRDSGPECWGF